MRPDTVPPLSLLLFVAEHVRVSADSLSSALGQLVLGLLRTLAGRFSLLCHLTGQHAASLTTNLRRGRDVKSLLILDHTSIFLDAHNECVHDLLAGGSILIGHNVYFIPSKVRQRRGQLPGDGRFPGSDQTLRVSNSAPHQTHTASVTTHRRDSHRCMLGWDVLLSSTIFSEIPSGSVLSCFRGWQSAVRRAPPWLTS